MLAFAEGPAPDGSLDTLYTADWAGPVGPPSPRPPGSLAPTGSRPGASGARRHVERPGGVGSPLVIDGRPRARSSSAPGQEPFNVYRSADGAETWERDVLDKHVCASTPPPRTSATPSSPATNRPDLAERRRRRGRDLGAASGTPTPTKSGNSTRSRSPRPSPAPPSPAPVSSPPSRAGWPTPTTGAETWIRSSLWQEFRYWPEGGIARHAIEGHPYGGVLYVGIRDGWVRLPGGLRERGRGRDVGAPPPAAGHDRDPVLPGRGGGRRQRRGVGGAAWSSGPANDGVDRAVVGGRGRAADVGAGLRRGLPEASVNASFSGGTAGSTQRRTRVCGGRRTPVLAVASEPRSARSRPQAISASTSSQTLPAAPRARPHAGGARARAPRGV